MIHGLAPEARTCRPPWRACCWGVDPHGSHRGLILVGCVAVILLDEYGAGGALVAVVAAVADFEHVAVGGKFGGVADGPALDRYPKQDDDKDAEGAYEIGEHGSAVPLRRVMGHNVSSSVVNSEFIE